MNKMKPHWYCQGYTECVACGKTLSKWRERIYGEKPKESEKRYSYIAYLCNDCMIGNY